MSMTIAGMPFVFPVGRDARFFKAVSEIDLKKKESMFKQLSKIIIDTHSRVMPIFVGSSIIAKNLQVHDRNSCVVDL